MVSTLPRTPISPNVERIDLNIASVGPGALLFDADGKEYLDFWSDLSTQSMGYQETADLVAEFARTGIPHQLPDLFTNPVRTQHAQHLCEAYGFERVFFSTSGAEGIEAAIKYARNYYYQQGRPQKFRCLTVAGNFHGRTYGAAGLTDARLSPYHKESFHQGDIDWPGFGIIELNQPFEEQIDPDQTAAIFTAPILGNNCVQPFARDFLADLREYCIRNDIILVFDEVQTGSGWLGVISGAEHYDIKPDMMVLGKRVAMGFAHSATLMSAAISDAIPLGGHFSTFGGSPFACWMGEKWLDWLYNHSGFETISTNGAFLARELRQQEWISNVTGVGMMLSFQPQFDGWGYDGFMLCEAAREEGLLIVTHRPFGEIRFTPPCNTPIWQLANGTQKLRRAHRKAASRARHS